MKYEFIKKEEDIYVLKYKDKEKEFKKDVKLMSDFQELNAKARIKMIKDLAKDGMTTKDLVIEKKEGNKTLYDNTNIKEMENTYIEKESIELLDNISLKYFDLNIINLMEDIGLEEDKETEEFFTEFITIIIGKEKEFPSKKN